MEKHFFLLPHIRTFPITFCWDIRGLEQVYGTNRLHLLWCRNNAVPLAICHQQVST